MASPSDSNFSDPRLTAYLLDELEPAERRAFEAELAADPQLQAALADLRRVSSILGRAFREEPLPPAVTKGRARPKASPPARLVPGGELSASARAARIARFRQEAPTLGKRKAKRQNFNGLVAALVASIALVGIFVLQRASDASARDEERRSHVVTTHHGRTVIPETLEERIESVIEDERAESEAQYAAVADEVANGLEEIQLAPPMPQADPASQLAQLDEALLFDPDGPDWLAPAAVPTELAASPTLDPQKEEKESPGRRREDLAAAVVAASPGFAAQVGDGFAPPPGPATSGAILGPSEIVAGGFRDPDSFPSTGFALQVKPVSYGVVREALQDDRWPQPGEVKLEELINQFQYAERAPTRRDPPFAVEMEVGQAPWEPIHYLVRITLKASEGLDPNDPTVARGVHAEVRFNPDQVAAFRLLGYETAAGEAPSAVAGAGGAIVEGQETTALYEIVPVGAPSVASRSAEADFETAPVARVAHGDPSSEMLWMEVRYHRPSVTRSRRVDFILHVPSEIPSWRETSRAFRWAAAVASFGMELKDDPFRGRTDWEFIQALARSAVGDEAGADELEFIGLIDDARRLDALRPGPRS